METENRPSGALNINDAQNCNIKGIESMESNSNEMTQFEDQPLTNNDNTGDQSPATETDKQECINVDGKIKSDLEQNEENQPKDVHSHDIQDAEKLNGSETEGPNSNCSEEEEENPSLAEIVRSVVSGSECHVDTGSVNDSENDNNGEVRSIPETEKETELNSDCQQSNLKTDPSSKEVQISEIDSHTANEVKTSAKSDLSEAKNFKNVNNSQKPLNCDSEESSTEPILTDNSIAHEAHHKQLSGIDTSNEPVDNTNMESNADLSEDQLLSELENELEVQSSLENSNPPNGLVNSDFKELVSRLELQQKELEEKNQLIDRLQESNNSQSSQLAEVTKQKNDYFQQLEGIRTGEQDQIYMAQLKEMENTIAQQTQEIKTTKEKLASHDAAAKRTVTALQHEMKTRIDQVSKMYEDCRKEKENMVIKYAQGEQKQIEYKQANEKLENKLKEAAKEREIMAGKFRNLKTDKGKLASAFESKVVELNAAQKEIEKLKETVSSQDVKVKWAQNKLKAELDAHKETKAEHQKTIVSLKQAKEETETIRKNCQQIVKTYQESEEIKSNSLDIELKRKQEELQKQQTEKRDQQEVYHIMVRELDSLKKQHKDAVEELKTLRDKVKCLEAERLQQEASMGKLKEIIQTQKRDLHQLKGELDEHRQYKIDLEKECEETKQLKAQLQDIQDSNKDMNQDMAACRKKEGELLEFTEKISAKNAQLQSENTGLSAKAASLSADLETFTAKCEELEAKNNTVTTQLNEFKQTWQEEKDMLSEKLGEKSKAVEQLSVDLDDARDEQKTLKRKHAANIKDLTRQLQQAKKKLETYEKDTDDTKSRLSAGSRTSSTSSLEKVNGDTTTQNNSGSSRGSSQEPSVQDPSSIPTYEIVEPNQQMLIERIVRLQKAHARKNEKLEFMEDHIRQLLDEVQKKARIIQSYVMREEAGALAPAAMDENKAQLSKKGGIMASVYNSHVADGHMSMDLSLEINRKLQAVLEDTILKNITLKENLDTLGAEIARLSQENRQIQLQIQTVNPKR